MPAQERQESSIFKGSVLVVPLVLLQWRREEQLQLIKALLKLPYCKGRSQSVHRTFHIHP